MKAYKLAEASGPVTLDFIKTSMTPETLSDPSKLPSIAGMLHDYILDSLASTSSAAAIHEDLTSVADASKLGVGFTVEVLYQVNLTLSMAAASSSDSGASEVKAKLFELIRLFVDRGDNNRMAVIERLDDQVLKNCGLIELQNFEKKKNRLMTKNFYEQQKFNLFREESEGYSKLSMELLELRDRYQDKFELCLQNITSLIGYFDLDINRVIDLIIEFFVHNTNTDLYLQLLSHFKKEFIDQILGYKFQKLHANLEKTMKPELTEKQFKKGANQPQAQLIKHLSKAAAKLIKAKLVNLEELWPHLEPADQTILDAYKDNYAIAFEMFKKNYAPKLTVTVEEIEKEKEENIRLDKTFKAQVFNNQKLWLMQALIQENDIVHFKQAFSSLGSMVDFYSFQLLLTTLTDYVEWYIEPCYRFLSPTVFSMKQPDLMKVPCKDELIDLELRHPTCDPVDIFKSPENADSYLAFMKQLESLLDIVKHDLASSPLLFSKLCRLLKHVQKKVQLLGRPLSENLTYGDVASKIEDIRFKIIKDYLITGLSMMECNPGATTEVWSLLESYSYIVRYQIYDDWFTNTVGLM